MALMAVLIVAILASFVLPDVDNDLAQGKYDLDGSNGSKFIFL